MTHVNDVMVDLLLRGDYGGGGRRLSSTESEIAFSKASEVYDDETNPLEDEDVTNAKTDAVLDLAITAATDGSLLEEILKANALSASPDTALMASSCRS